jgi:hypothetical protein
MRKCEDAAMRGNKDSAKQDSRKTMKADIAKFRGSSSSYDHQRPGRKVVTRRTK